MTLKNQIKRMLTEYPDLYQDRAQCLNQLFCVIGNGYEWKNGQLVSKYNDELSDKEKKEQSQRKEMMAGLLSASADLVERDYNKWFSVKMSETTAFQLLEFYRKDRAAKNINKIIQPGFHEYIQKGFIFYPLSQYSKIVAYPKDIQPDWLNGLKETKLLLNKYGFGSKVHKEVSEFLSKVNKDKRLK